MPCRSVLRPLVLAAACALWLTSSAQAQGLPGLRGLDHTSVTVPNMAEAEAFFVGLLGCKKAAGFGPVSDAKGTVMQDTMNVHPRTVIKQLSLLRCGYGSNIELYEYTAPDQSIAQPKISDIGGHQIAFYVDDINAATIYLREQGVRTLSGPLTVNDGAIAGQSILYFFTPWGMQLKLISYPDGMAYEENSGVILWSPKAPGN